MSVTVTTLLLVRHAESAANASARFGSQSDSPLTERGIKQAAQLAEALAAIKIDAVYSSDLSRARDTVAPIAAARGLEVRQTPLLRERSVGVLTGLLFEEAKTLHPEAWEVMWSRHPTKAPPEGESLSDLQARVATMLESVRAEQRGNTVVIGSHGGTISAMLRVLGGVHDMENPLGFSVQNASVSRVDVTESSRAMTTRLLYVSRVVPLDGEPHFP